jgi:hypothetical protein
MMGANFHDSNPVQNPSCTVHLDPVPARRVNPYGRPANVPNPNPGNPRLGEYHGFPLERQGEATNSI